jgi:hypothetical protein
LDIHKQSLVILGYASNQPRDIGSDREGRRRRPRPYNVLGRPHVLCYAALTLSTKRQPLALSTEKLGYRFFEPEDTPPGTPA